MMIDFQKDVIDKSFELPVVVDFWAPWCGPCRVLGPIIEEIAEEQKGQWDLVKINTEEHEDLSVTYQIRSIPNVKMFYRGEVIHEFMGALPRQMIYDWLKKVLPSPGLRALDKLLASTDVPTQEDLEQLLETYPDSQEVRLVLSQVILWKDPKRATDLLEPIKMGSPFYDKATWLRDIADFMLMQTEDEDLERVQGQLKEAYLEEAIQEMIRILSQQNSIADGKLSKAAIGIFNTLGVQHPLTKTFRKQLDMALWV